MECLVSVTPPYTPQECRFAWVSHMLGKLTTTKLYPHLSHFETRFCWLPSWPLGSLYIF